ncbi:hypothetical protein EDD17DRAFT_1509549 [Pisolithus thermaeus]|nr:hypothetical protein EDD17DRAFT_1509549 [Pisolithus thermaeus]
MSSHHVTQLPAHFQLIPDLVAVVMIVIWCRERVLPSRKLGDDRDVEVLFCFIFLRGLIPILYLGLGLSKSITIGGHIWCHLATVEYFIWVREVRGNPIDTDNSSADSSTRGMLFPEVRMGEVDAMLDKAISAFKGSIVLFLNNLENPSALDMAYDRYQCWLQKHILPRHKWKPSIILPDMPVSSRPCLDARGGNLTNTTRTNTCLASLTAIPNCSSSSSPSSSGSEVLSSLDTSSDADDAIYGARDV